MRIKTFPKNSTILNKDEDIKFSFILIKGICMNSNEKV
jgi:hypothetical protein